MHERRQRRVAKTLLAKVTMTTAEFFVYIQDVAKEGVSFSCNRKIDMGAKLGLAVNAPKYPTMDLKGDLVWVRDLPTISRNKFLYGVHLTEAPDVYQEFVDTLVRHDYERRRDPRFSDVLTVAGDDVLDLLDAATTDVSAGGLYIRTGKPLEVGTSTTSNW